MTFEEFKNQNPIQFTASKDFITTYVEENEAQIKKRLGTVNIQELFSNNTDYGEKWIEETLPHWKLITTATGGGVGSSAYELNAYLQPTIYEQEQQLKAQDFNIKAAEELAYKLAKAKSNDNEKAQSENKGNLLALKKQELDKIIEKLGLKGKGDHELMMLMHSWSKTIEQKLAPEIERIIRKKLENGEDLSRYYNGPNLQNGMLREMILDTSNEIDGVTKDQQLFIKLMAEKMELEAKQRRRMQDSSSEFFGVLNEMKMLGSDDDKIERVQRNSHNDIWGEWKDSVENHPMVISSKYNIEEYESMIRDHTDKESMNKLWIKLNNLFNQCLVERKILMHKYFVYVLGSNMWTCNEIPEIKFDSVPIYILFDCGDIIIDKITVKVRLDISGGSWTPEKSIIQSIKALTGNNISYNEEKNDIESEKRTKINWDNFKNIGECIQLDIKNSDEMTYSESDDFQQEMRYQTRTNIYRPHENENICKLTSSNERYILLRFNDERIKGLIGDLNIQNISFYEKGKTHAMWGDNARKKITILSACNTSSNECDVDNIYSENETSVYAPVFNVK
eukprot:545015_1